jgi:hypothetical protein
MRSISETDDLFPLNRFSSKARLVSERRERNADTSSLAWDIIQFPWRSRNGGALDSRLILNLFFCLRVELLQ